MGFVTIGFAFSLAPVAIASASAGVMEEVTGYRTPDGAKLEFIDLKGNAVRVEKDVTIFVKKTPEAAKQCGGISFWPTPAAQLGASFFSSEDALIVDPFTARVWFKLRQQ